MSGTAKVLDLSGSWRYFIDKNGDGDTNGFAGSGFDYTGWPEIAVPNNWWLTDIGDYFGVIWHQTEFDGSQSMVGNKNYLRFNGVDYYADVWLNGVFVGFHEGGFTPFEFDVTDVLNYDGRNTLVVKVDAPRDPTEYVPVEGHPTNRTPLSQDFRFHQAKEITLIKGHMIDAMHRPGAMTKFRQDGNSGGIWDKVELVSRKKIFVKSVRTYNKIEIKKDWLGDLTDKPTGNALVTADVTIENHSGTAVKTDLTITVTPCNFKGDEEYRESRQVCLVPGTNTFKMTVTVEDAKLWWTWDHGEPNLYTMTITSDVCDDYGLNIGIKEVVHDEPSGQWYLNGKKIFLRGMRYISSMWMSEVDEKLVKSDLDKMLDMDINSIRIGSHIEKDFVYRMCDEMGFLLWQVFPLHYCVSDSDDFISRASDMMRDVGMMICNHACLGMWSVYKEPEIYGLQDKPNNYFRLCEILKETLGTIDPVRWIHKGDYREGAQNLMIGCCQDANTDLHRTAIDPQVVEFGAASIPCEETLRKIIPEEDLWPPNWDTWEYWGLFYALTFLNAELKTGDSLQEFIDITQEYEAKVVKEQIEFLRQKKYKPVASMYLYYWSDPCACIGSGLLDYYRKKYKVYDAMKAVYTPVLVSFEWDADPYIIGKDKVYRAGTSFTGSVWIANDNYHDIEDAKMSWTITDAEKKSVTLSGALTLTVPEDSSAIVQEIVWNIPADTAGDFLLNMKVEDGDGTTLSENYFDFIVG